MSSEFTENRNTPPDRNTKWFNCRPFNFVQTQDQVSIVVDGIHSMVENSRALNKTKSTQYI